MFLLLSNFFPRKLEHWTKKHAKLHRKSLKPSHFVGSRAKIIKLCWLATKNKSVFGWKWDGHSQLISSFTIYAGIFPTVSHLRPFPPLYILFTLLSSIIRSPFRESVRRLSSFWHLWICLTQSFIIRILVHPRWGFTRIF